MDSEYGRVGSKLLRRESYLALGIALLAVALAIWGGPGNSVTLTTSVAQGVVGAGRYDSLESPRGTDYQVPSGQTFYVETIVGLPQVAAGTNVYVELGYGNDAVNNSLAAPTSAVAVASWSYVAANDQPLRLMVTGEVPGTRYPYIFVSQAMAATVTGKTR